MSNENNGLVTAVWGPALWTSLHSITFGYPIQPTEEQKNDYKQLFTLIGKTMPCKYCRESYSHFIITEPTILNDTVMTNRQTLTKWLYDIHERVNQKLNKNYAKTYDQIVQEYETSRAKCSKSSGTKIVGCKMPLGDKKETFFVASIKDSPIIDVNIAVMCKKYATERGLDTSESEFLHFYQTNPTIKNNDRKCNSWCKRNKECMVIKDKMRINGIPALETEGKYTDLPTIDELKLILRLTTTMEKEELDKLKIKLIEYNKQETTGGNNMTITTFNNMPRHSTEPIIEHKEEQETNIIKPLQYYKPNLTGSGSRSNRYYKLSK